MAALAALGAAVVVATLTETYWDLKNPDIATKRLATVPQPI